MIWIAFFVVLPAAIVYARWKSSTGTALPRSTDIDPDAPRWDRSSQGGF